MPPLAGVPSSASQALKLWAQQVLAQIQAAGGATGVNAIPQQYALVAGSALPPIASVSNCSVALDTTKQLFGAGSYKVSLTGSPAVLTLGAKTAWPLQPSWQWLVSFFQQATAAVSGQVTITTSAGNAYAATFTTTLDTAGWERLYDALNLVADTSAAFGLSFTFTGGAGQTVWLDGLMLSPFYGRPSVLPSFQSGSAPLLLDNNPDGFYSKILSSRTAGNVAFNFRGAWSSTANYLTGDEVVYGPTYWVALTDSTNVQPATGVSAWQAVGSYSEFVGAWSSTDTYAVGAEVTYSGSYWVAVAQNSNSAPSTTNANWQIAGSTSAAAITYTDGSTVQSLQPAEASADVTATHTANDTSNVNGVAAATISQGAGRANAAIDSTNIVVASGIDLSRAYINKTLTNIPDGSGRFAVTNISGGNAVSSVDSNNRALIDFSQSGHLYKTLDNINNGATYARGLYSNPNLAVDSEFLFGGGGGATYGGWYLPASTAFGQARWGYGTNAIIFNYTTVNNSGAFSPFITLPNGATFTLSETVDCTGAQLTGSGVGVHYVQIAWYDSAQAIISYVWALFNATGGVVQTSGITASGLVAQYESEVDRVFITATAPAGAIYAKVNPQIAYGNLTGGNVVISNPQFEAGSAPNAYTPNLVLTATQDYLADGNTYGRFKNSYFDSLSTRRVATINGAMAPQGSVASGASSVVFSYSSTDSSVTPAWTAGTLYRMDGTTTAVGSGSQAVTGLSASTTYYSAAYYDETSGAVSFVTGASGAVGTPAICYTSQTAAVAAVASQQANLNFGWLSMTTAASGGTGGGGTGGACCVAGRQRVRMGDGSWKFAEDIEAGDILPCPGGVTTVRAPSVVPWRDWRRVAFENGIELIVAEGHRFVDPAGAQRYAVDLRVNDVIQTDSGYTRVVAIALDEHLAQRVSVEVNAPHLYYLNGILCHNKYVCQ